MMTLDNHQLMPRKVTKRATTGHSSLKATVELLGEPSANATMKMVVGAERAENEQG